MKKRLLNISGKINDLTLDAFDAISYVTKALGIPFFVIGAKARDMVLMDGYSIETIRRTEDVDFGIQISIWDQFEKVKQQLIKTGFFTPTRETQRLVFKESLMVDVVPFGYIWKHDESLHWPPDYDLKMSIRGFNEAYKHSLTVRLRDNPPLDIQVASPAGLAIMKIISWSDNYPLRDRDAKDLSLLMKTYLDTGNKDRLYKEDADLMGEDFDYIRASARLLGRDIAAIANPDTAKALLKILDQETGEQDRYRLVEDMRDRSIFRDNFEEHLQLLEELKAGVLEHMTSSGK